MKPIMRIYFARHGQTEWNVGKRYQGRADSPLTQKGREQALATAQRLQDTGITHIYSSPLGRARLTADIIAERIDLIPEIIDDLAEIDTGEWTGLAWAEVEQRYPEEFRKRAADKLNYCMPGGESYFDLTIRAGRVIPFLLAQSHEKQLVVSHSAIGRALIVGCVGMEPQRMFEIYQPNDILYIVDVNGEERSLGHIGSDGYREGIYKI